VKRTLVERVACAMTELVTCWPGGYIGPNAAVREARRIIAMVRRHDRKEKGK
jgi:hypothetical protein